MHKDRSDGLITIDQLMHNDRSDVCIMINHYNVQG